MIQLLVLALVVGFLIGAVLTAIFARRFASRRLKAAEEDCETFRAGFVKAKELLGVTKKKMDDANDRADSLAEQVRSMSDRRS